MRFDGNGGGDKPADPKNDPQTPPSPGGFPHPNTP